MNHSPGTRRRRLVWTLTAKVVLTFALALPSGRRGPVEFRSLSALPGVYSGTPVTLSGMLIGHVVAKHQRGDTTLITVRFERGAGHLPGDRVVVLRPMGLEQSVAVEIQPVAQRPSVSVARGGWLRVVPWSPPPHWPLEIGRLQAAPPEQPSLPSMPILRPLPRRGPLAAA
jgi:hypothetical protein